MAHNVILDDNFLPSKPHFSSLALLAITSPVMKGFHGYHSCLVSLQIPLIGGLPAFQLTEISNGETKLVGLSLALNRPKDLGTV